MGAMRLIDSHGHLNADRFDDDLDAVLGTAQEAGVERILVPGWNVRSSGRALEVVASRPWLDAAVGIHPHDAAKVDEAGWALIEAWAQDDRVVRTQPSDDYLHVESSMNSSLTITGLSLPADKREYDWLELSLREPGTRAEIQRQNPYKTGQSLKIKAYAEDKLGRNYDSIFAWDQDRFGNGTMILADGKFIVLTERGDLHLIEATSTAFRELAKIQLFTSGPCRAQIALANGKLFARDQKKLVCVEMAK